MADQGIRVRDGSGVLAARPILEGGIRRAPQPFEESLFLERKYNITTIFGFFFAVGRLAYATAT